MCLVVETERKPPWDIESKTIKAAHFFTLEFLDKSPEFDDHEVLIGADNSTSNTETTTKKSVKKILYEVVLLGIYIPIQAPSELISIIFSITNEWSL